MKLPIDSPKLLSFVYKNTFPIINLNADKKIEANLPSSEFRKKRKQFHRPKNGDYLCTRERIRNVPPRSEQMRGREHEGDDEEFIKTIDVGW